MSRGFTLVELLVVLALAALLAGAAVPGYRAHLQRGARADAVDALTRLQGAQERFRSAHGLYAAQLAPLALSERSPQGRYRIALAPTGPEAYRATATSQGAGAEDGECAQLTLEVNAGFATPGPHARCWNR